MPVDERTRRMMGESFVRIHGAEVADAIMAHLPPVTYSELATKQDVREAVAELRAEMHQGFAEVRNGFAEVQKQFTGVQREFAGVHERFTGVQKEFAGVHERFTGVHERFAGVHEQIAGLYRNINRATLVLVAALLSSPILGVLAERLIPR